METSRRVLPQLGRPLAGSPTVFRFGIAITGLIAVLTAVLFLSTERSVWASDPPNEDPPPPVTLSITPADGVVFEGRRLVLTVAASGLTSGDLPVQFTVAPDANSATNNDASLDDYSVVGDHASLDENAGAWTGTITLTTDSPQQNLVIAATGDDDIDDFIRETVLVTVSGDGVDTVSVPVIINEGLCSRSPYVWWSLLERINSENNTSLNCAQVTDAHLAALNQPGLAVNLSDEGILFLSTGDLHGLDQLTRLNLRNNWLRGLPAEFFKGLTKLERVWFDRYYGYPHASLFGVKQPVYLEGVDDLDQFVAIVHEHAPFDITVEISANPAVKFDGSSVAATTHSVVIPQGSGESPGVSFVASSTGEEVTFSVASASYPTGADVRGLTLVARDKLGVSIISSRLVLRDMWVPQQHIREGETGKFFLFALKPVGTDVSVPVTFYTGSSEDPDSSDVSQAGSGYAVFLAGHVTATVEIDTLQDDVDEGLFEHLHLVVAAPTDGSAYEFGEDFPGSGLIEVWDGVCDRVPDVRDAIVARLGGVLGDLHACFAVDGRELARVTTLFVNMTGDSREVSRQDFAGLTELRDLTITDNLEGEYSADVFADLDALRVINLTQVSEDTLAQGIFAGMNALEYVYLNQQALRTFPDGLFRNVREGGLKGVFVNADYGREINVQVEMHRTSPGETMPDGTISNDHGYVAVVHSGAAFKLYVDFDSDRREPIEGTLSIEPGHVQSALHPYGAGLAELKATGWRAPIKPLMSGFTYRTKSEIQMLNDQGTRSESGETNESEDSASQVMAAPEASLSYTLTENHLSLLVTLSTAAETDLVVRYEFGEDPFPIIPNPVDPGTIRGRGVVRIQSGVIGTNVAIPVSEIEGYDGESAYEFTVSISEPGPNAGYTLDSDNTSVIITLRPS